jgi:hypothetical protein
MDNSFIDLAVLISEPEADYHAKSGEYETSHLLNDFIKCPKLHYLKVTGQIPDKDTPAWLLGRATHKRILEGREAFEQAFSMSAFNTSGTPQPLLPTA